MKKIILIFTILSLNLYSQEGDKVLVTINNEKIRVSEFKKIYEKNSNNIEDKEAKNISKILDLFINYKLKVKEAYELKYDTLRSYKRELVSYKNQLIAPYLQDISFLKKLTKEAYYRTANEIKVQHILVRLKKNSIPQDTLKAYRKIEKARKEILSGKLFKLVAKKYSEDPSVKKNGGNLGYFSAFKMVYPFEDAAYKTKIGEVSMPFKTRFGYHIVQVNGTRKSKGKVEVAHILITDRSNKGKIRIDSIFEKLQKGENFVNLAKQYSNDSSSKNMGGKLEKFGTGIMLESFEKVSFSLEKKGNYSKPFLTRFGWHIVMLLKKYPIGSFEEMKEEITNNVKRSGRKRLSDDVVLNRLKKEYKIVDDIEGISILKDKNIFTKPKKSLRGTLFSINEKHIKQGAFVKYLRNRRNKPVFALFKAFKNQEILTYFKDNLIYTEPKYAAILQEYTEGLLLFELMQNKIWNKSAKDSIGLKKYFNHYKSNYKSKKLEDIKNQVINDYQNYLDKKWVLNLRKRNKIKVNKRQLKKLIKFYKNKI